MHITNKMVPKRGKFIRELRIGYHDLAEIRYHLNNEESVRLIGLEEDVVFLCQQGGFTDREKIIGVEQET